MGKNFDSLEGFIQAHINQLFQTSGLADGDESLEVLATAWLEKKLRFEQTVAQNEMEEVESFKATDQHGAILMTYSGSLVNVGPLQNGTRKVAYASIGLRKDVPQQESRDQCVMDSDLKTDATANFKQGPIRRTSPVLKIACFRSSLAPTVETERLNELTSTISTSFVMVNRNVGDQTS